MIKKIIKITALITLISTSPNLAKAKENIVILATGGTIAGTASKASDASYSPSKVMVNDIIASVPDLANVANITGEQFSQIASQNMNSEFWLKLSKRVSELASKSSVDGIVITHGTDTMEETAYFLNLTVHTKKPIILVGSMRPSTSLSADGPLNLFNAVSVAASKSAREKGVLLVLNDNIYAARDVTKFNTTNTIAFESPNFGPIGHVIYGKPQFYYSSTRLHTYKSIFDVSELKSLPEVEIIYSYTDQDASFMDELVKANTAGIVGAGVGDGNFYKDTLSELVKASKGGVRVVRSSRIGAGFVVPNSEINDDEYQFITADNLNPQKARILLMLALTKTDDYKKIREYFSQY